MPFHMLHHRRVKRCPQVLDTGVPSRCALGEISYLDSGSGTLHNLLGRPSKSCCPQQNGRAQRSVITPARGQSAPAVWRFSQTHAGVSNKGGILCCNKNGCWVEIRNKTEKNHFQTRKWASDTGNMAARCSLVGVSPGSWCRSRDLTPACHLLLAASVAGKTGKTGRSG